jgi:hypothetical protein
MSNSPGEFTTETLTSQAKEEMNRRLTQMDMNVKRLMNHWTLPLSVRLNQHNSLIICVNPRPSAVHFSF